MTLTKSGPNAEQIEYWNEVSGPKWVALSDLLDAQIGSIGLAAIDRAGVSPGERVLDVGCGCGQTSLHLAERVGAEGRVLGIDISGPMLERARERAASLPHVSFLQADAQTQNFDEPFDVAFSRFGVMFFSQPDAAFANLATSLAPGGRISFVCWQELGRNPWMLVPILAAAKHVELPPPPEPGAPGPFSFADAERVRGILERGGFADVEILPLEDELSIGGKGTLERTVEFVAQIGPAGNALREVDESTRAKALEAVHEALAPFHGPEGVRMPFAAWIVSARRSST